MTKQYVWFFFYFIIFVFTFFNGITIFRTKSLRSPFSARKYIEGRKAVIIGSLLIIAGLVSLYLFIRGFTIFLN